MTDPVSYTGENGDLGDYVYDLLPAVYRIRDEERATLDGGPPPLRALIEVIAEELGLLEDNIAQLYDNAFIETCQSWAAPYIGDLLSVPMLNQGSPQSFALRAYIADTLAFRRRKGCAAIVSQVARSLCGWGTHSRESTAVLALTQNVNAVLEDAPGWVDVADSAAMAKVGTPFATARRAVSVRRTAPVGAEVNTLTVFVWPLQSYPLHGVKARAITFEKGARKNSQGAPWGFTFDPSGRDGALFNRPQPAVGVTDPTYPANLSIPLERLALYEDINVLRRNLGLSIPPCQHMPDDFDWSTAASRSRYFSQNPVFRIRVGENEVLPQNIYISDLEGWPRLPAEIFAGELSVAVDPVLGRLAFPEGQAPMSPPIVDFSYGFSADVGAGPFDRGGVEARGRLEGLDWFGEVNQGARGEKDVYATIAQGVAAWRAFAATRKAARGAIIVSDSATYATDLTGVHALSAPEGSTLLVIAAGAPSVVRSQNVSPDGGPFHVSADISGVRPHILANVEVTDSADGGPSSRVIVDGFLIEGEIRLTARGRQSVQFRKSTLIPGLGEVSDAGVGGLAQVDATFSGCICGSMRFGGGVTRVALDGCIVDGDGAAAIDAPYSAFDIRATTLFGETHCAALDAENTIFSRPVLVERQQEGRILFSYVPEPSATPKRFCCQPDLAAAGLAQGARRQAAVRAMVPVFESRAWGDCRYGRLARNTAPGLLRGATSGSEMGVFGVILTAQRWQNLALGLPDYLPIALTATYAQET